MSDSTPAIGTENRCSRHPDRETFVAEEGGRVFGTYFLRANQLGGGAHVANCGFMTSTEATRRGIPALSHPLFCRGSSSPAMIQLCLAMAAI